MRIFTAALITETNTFSPIPTGWSSFEEFGIQRGRDGLRPAFHTGAMLAWENLARADGHEIVHGIAAAASPAGLTVRSTYEALREEILHDVAVNGPFDVVLLALHGAMVAEGYDDCEGDLLVRLRDAVGCSTRIGVLLDLHCHLTQAMLNHADVMITFKEYPHTDAIDRAREVYRIAMDCAHGRIRPVCAVHDCRMIGVYFTQAKPMRAFTDAMSAQEGRDGILSVSLIHGFPWADVRDGGTKVLVYADGDASQAAATARALAKQFWAVRNRVAFKGLTVDEALDDIGDAPGGLIVLADCADNSGAGAPGDSTFILQRLLERNVHHVALGPVWDPVAVSICRSAGIDARLALRVGGKCSPASGTPLDLQVIVRGLNEELKVPAFGSDLVSYGSVALVEIDGADVHIVLCSYRMQAFGPALFTELGLDLRQQRLVVVKSSNHFEAGFRSLAARIMHVDGPGAVTANMARIPFKHRSLEYWPRVADPFAKNPAS